MSWYQWFSYSLAPCSCLLAALYLAMDIPCTTWIRRLSLFCLVVGTGSLFSAFVTKIYPPATPIGIFTNTGIFLFLLDLHGRRIRRYFKRRKSQKQNKASKSALITGESTQ